uniref:Uncharacterized protein n=1 Tax=Corethron hystrix TaxID=216773 RepID=A0A7S1BRJ7_9STRA|mmetsp:Transcript_35816/g.83449  ORF Transcript_35816/g.83449 Transcript_35816/m.83449 type:complete len:385 (+) Transcript_35816:144-1298(+)
MSNIPSFDDTKQEKNLSSSSSSSSEGHTNAEVKISSESHGQGGNITEQETLTNIEPQNGSLDFFLQETDDTVVTSQRNKSLQSKSTKSRFGADIGNETSCKGCGFSGFEPERSGTPSVLRPLSLPPAPSRKHPKTMQLREEKQLEKTHRCNIITTHARSVVTKKTRREDRAMDNVIRGRRRRIDGRWQCGTPPPLRSVDTLTRIEVDGKYNDDYIRSKGKERRMFGQSISSTHSLSSSSPSSSEHGYDLRYRYATFVYPFQNELDGYRPSPAAVRLVLHEAFGRLCRPVCAEAAALAGTGGMRPWDDDERKAVLAHMTSHVRAVAEIVREKIRRHGVRNYDVVFSPWYSKVSMMRIVFVEKYNSISSNAFSLSFSSYCNLHLCP